MTACAEGLSSDDAGGCRAMLPDEPCADGTIAIPGDTACHPLGACAEPPADATLFVDATAVDGGDGSRTRPFRTIAAAVAAAPSGAIVAIGAGTYVEGLVLPRPVTLVGRCAAEVTVKSDATYTIRANSDVTLRALAVTGSGVGISAHDAARVVVERTWVHDTGNFGVYASSAGAASSMTIRDSLIERATATGLNVSSAEVVVERTVVRDTRARATDRLTGYGVVAKHWRSTTVLATPPRMTVRRSVIERNDTANVIASAAELALEGSVIRDARPRPLDGQLGACVQAQDDPDVDDVGTLSIKQSFLSGCSESGVIVVGTRADIEGTTIRNILPRKKDDLGGIGVSAQIETDSHRAATVNLRDSLVVDTRYVGVLSVGSTVSLEGSIVRDTRVESATNLYGDGVGVVAWSDGTTAFEAPLSIARSIVSGSARAGVSVFGTRASLRDVRLVCNRIDLDAERAYTGPVVGDVFPEREFVIDDDGGNVCGCETTATCRAVSTSLRPIDRVTQ